MDKTDVFRSYGDIVIDYIDLVIDDKHNSLLDVFVELNIYEDVFSPLLSGSIAILDSNNLIKNLNILGGENQQIKFKFKTKGSQAWIEGVMCVYKISERVEINENTMAYKLHLISKEAFINNSKLISRSFKGLYSQHINALLDDISTTKERDITDTAYPVSWISMNWKPIEAITWVTDRSISQQTFNASFVFYEDCRGFKFKSLEDVFSSDPVVSYKKKTTNTINDQNDYESLFFSPKDIKINHSSNLLSCVDRGVYGSTYIEHDIVKKTIVEKNTVWSDYKHIENNPLTDNIYNGSGVRYSPMHNNRTIYSGDNIRRQTTRQSFLAGLSVSSVTLSVSLNSSLCVGVLVNLEIPSPEHVENTAKKNGHLHGKHLITKLSHFVTPDQGETIIEAIKDSVYLEENRLA